MQVIFSSLLFGWWLCWDGTQDLPKSARVQSEVYGRRSQELEVVEWYFFGPLLKGVVLLPGATFWLFVVRWYFTLICSITEFVISSH